MCHNFGLHPPTPAETLRSNVCPGNVGGDRVPRWRGDGVAQTGEDMNVDDIRILLDLVKTHELAEFELETEDVKLRVRRAGPAPVVSVPPPVYQPLPAAAFQGQPTHIPAPAAAPAEPAESADLAIVKSPIVGTFYKSPEPNAPSFAEKGTQVKKGQVLCIIEAMKLMNEIESDYDGEVVAVYIENGQPVQYGERLFAIKVK
jgi:acetyl-CoA carboxylase biotin carboxyl carrier protein